MLFAGKAREERFLPLDSKAQAYASSSYLGEQDALVWACRRTKAFRGGIPLVQTDNHALLDKWRSRAYMTQERVIRRRGWLLVDEPESPFESVPRSKNTGADLLSKSVGKGVKDILSPTSKEVN